MDMHLDGYVADLEAKPGTLRALADALPSWPLEPGRRLLLSGMGSSWFAAETVARHLRAAGVTAVAEIASADALWPPAADLVAIGISASGGSAETLEVLRRYHGESPTVALTNTDRAVPADHVVPMLAGPEDGGVACRSYTHTLAALLHLQAQLAGTPTDLPGVLRRAADATEDLLTRREEWVPPVAEALAGPHGTWLLAPAERLGNALQGALMLREGPRRAADGCETGDWSHVDVYLTKTLDYRALVFTGSRHDPAAAQWMRERGTTVAVVGRPGPYDAAVVVRHAYDDEPLVRLLTEVLVPELVAAHWWSGR